MKPCYGMKSTMQLILLHLNTCDPHCRSQCRNFMIGGVNTFMLQPMALNFLPVQAIFPATGATGVPSEVN